MQLKKTLNNTTSACQTVQIKVVYNVSNKFIQ